MNRMVWAVILLLAPLTGHPALSDDAVLAQIAANLSRPTVLRSDFTQTKTVAAMTRPIVTSGKFVYAREQGILWKIEQPYRVTYALSEKGAAEVDANGVAVRAANQSQGLQHVGRIFRALFEADFAALGQYFVPTVSGSANRWELTLAPRGPLRQVFKNVRVRGARFVEEVNFDEANGDTMMIRFLNIREAGALDGDELRAHRRE